ncbi:MAG TPA: hypothetical protein VIK31_08075 [Propionibacteriaceae bacterium]
MSDDDYAQGTGETEDAPDDFAPDEEDFEDDFVDVDIMEASMTAFGTVSCDEFGATQSAIASASVAGDAEISSSLVGAISADSAGLRQGAAVAVVVSGDAALSQSATSLVVARSVEMETVGACCVIASDVTVARSWVGFMAARNAEISDDSRVIIDTRAGLIIGALLFGGLGLLAVATYLGARRIAERIPRLPHMPHLPQMPQMPHLADLPHLPDLPALGAMVARIRRAA